MLLLRSSYVPHAWRLADTRCNRNPLVSACPQMCDVPEFDAIWAAASGANVRGEGNAQQLLHAAMILQANVRMSWCRLLQWAILLVLFFQHHNLSRIISGDPSGTAPTLQSRVLK